MLKKAFAITTVLALGLGIASTLLHPIALADAPKVALTCIPVQQFAQDKTQIECRLRADVDPKFYDAEITLPFAIKSLIKISTSYGGVMGKVYDVKVVDRTVVIASVNYGNDGAPVLQPIPFDALSLLLETDQSMSAVKAAFKANKANIALLSPNPNDPTKPLFQNISPDQALLFDGTLILEGFSKYNTVSVINFLLLGLSCYDKSPSACLSNIVDKL